MKNLFMKHIKTKCEVVVNEENITNVLEVLNLHRINSNLSIGSCEWNEDNMWYIMFDATGKQMTSIKSMLREKNFKNVLVISNTNTWAKIEKLI